MAIHMQPLCMSAEVGNRRSRLHPTEAAEPGFSLPGSSPKSQIDAMPVRRNKITRCGFTNTRDPERVPRYKYAELMMKTLGTSEPSPVLLIAVH
jgi:hypothetical protein